MAASTELAVVGMGNVLQSDDALGPYVVRSLESRFEFPSAVSLMDLGTPGLDLHPHITGLDTLILIDTVRSDGAPGELRRYDKEQILRHPPPARVSPHDPGLKETLLSLEFAGQAPREVVLIGVIPGSTEQGTGLTAAVRDALPRVEAAVLEELRIGGHVATSRVTPQDPDIWWEREPELP